MTITGLNHPYLHAYAFTCAFSQDTEALPSAPWLRQLLAPEGFTLLSELARELGLEALKAPDEALKKAIRQVLRFGGFKPSGRSKPASEYLVRAAADGTLSSINAGVDILNAMSLHSGLPISVIDLDLCQPPLSIKIGEAGEKYVFNSSGQEIELEGLICLYDSLGPCANAVKDSQRTKTNAHTRRTLTVIWGALAFSSQTLAVAKLYQGLLHKLAQEAPELELTLEPVEIII